MKKFIRAIRCFFGNHGWVQTGRKPDRRGIFFGGRAETRRYGCPHCKKDFGWTTTESFNIKI